VHGLKYKADINLRDWYQTVKQLRVEEPYAGNLHVRFCGGVYPGNGVDLPDPQKTLTSIRLDKEIVEVAKKRAKEEGVGYLTWLNKKLRLAVLGEEGLEDRVNKLEQAVFSKKKAI
jgi:hypothetical protein